MPINNTQPLRGLNRMSLSGLTDRERELWYKANNHLLAQYSYNPEVRRKAAEQIYQNQQFVQKFGEAEFNKTAGLPGSDVFRRKQLENRLTKEAILNTFKPVNQVITDIDTGLPYHMNGKPMEIHRKPEEANISDEEFGKLMRLDQQGQRQVLEDYANGKWKPES